MKKLRVLHCPHSVGGNAAGLVEAERELGLVSCSVAFDPSPFGYHADFVLRGPRVGRARFELRRLQLLWHAIRSVDVVHFNFGSAILPLPARGPGASRAYALYARIAGGLDLALLHRLGKGVVVTFQGDDVRQGDVLRKTYERSLADEVGPGYYTPAGDAAKRAIAERFNRYAHAIRFLNPDLARVLPERARFMPYAHVDPRRWTPRPRPAADVPLVVHAPSRRDTKGTTHVVAAVEALRRDSVPLRFELIEGRTQAEARAVYEQADLVVDQLVSGWYGGLAVETMALGVPVVAFIRAEDLNVVPSAMRTELPLVNANPTTIERVLRSLLTEGRLHELPERGRRSRSFAERWHDPLRIAADLLPVYEAAARSAAR